MPGDAQPPTTPAGLPARVLVPHAPHLECFAAAFEDLLDQLTDLRGVDRSFALARNLRAPPAGLAGRRQACDQLCVAENGDVGVVRGEDELTAPWLAIALSASGLRRVIRAVAAFGPIRLG